MIQKNVIDIKNEKMGYIVYNQYNLSFFFKLRQLEPGKQNSFTIEGKFITIEITYNNLFIKQQI